MTFFLCLSDQESEISIRSNPKGGFLFAGANEAKETIEERRRILVLKNLFRGD